MQQLGSLQPAATCGSVGKMQGSMLEPATPTPSALAHLCTGVCRGAWVFGMQHCNCAGYSGEKHSMNPGKHNIAEVSDLSCRAWLTATGTAQRMQGLHLMLMTFMRAHGHSWTAHIKLLDTSNQRLVAMTLHAFEGRTSMPRRLSADPSVNTQRQAGLIVTAH